jgi:hypothetical protein
MHEANSGRNMHSRQIIIAPRLATVALPPPTAGCFVWRRRRRQKQQQSLIKQSYVTERSRRRSRLRSAADDIVKFEDIFKALDYFSMHAQNRIPVTNIVWLQTVRTILTHRFGLLFVASPNTARLVV